MGLANDGSLWRWSASDGSLYPIVREGEVAANTQGAVISSLVDFAVSGNGKVAVNATLVPGVGDCTKYNDVGVWMDGGNDGVPLLRCREGDHVDLGGAETAVVIGATFDATVNAAGGWGGHGKILNGSGELIIRANYSYTNQTSGALILTPTGPVP